MTSVMPMETKKRADVVTDGNNAADIVANAPLTDQLFFWCLESWNRVISALRLHATHEWRSENLLNAAKASPKSICVKPA